MDEFSDQEIQISVESEDDTRLTLTMVNIEGRKISMDEFLTELEIYIKEIRDAEAERNLMGAVTQ